MYTMAQKGAKVKDLEELVRERKESEAVSCAKQAQKGDKVKDLKEQVREINKSLCG